LNWDPVVTEQISFTINDKVCIDAMSISFATSIPTSLVRVTTLVFQEKRGMTLQAATLGSIIGIRSVNSFLIVVPILRV